MIQTASLSWFGIFRLGLVQTALGSVVVLTTSTLNRIMVVELALPAILPGLLVALHYWVQILRPRMGHGSDRGGRRTPWVIGGVIVLALGGFLATIATVWMASSLTAGILLAVVAFIAIGGGVGAAGTTLLVLLAKQTAPARRAAAATIVWTMMILGIVVTAGVAGHFLDPYSPSRLVLISAVIGAVAICLTLVAVHGVEVVTPDHADAEPAAHTPFRAALAEVWNEPLARSFAVFIFISMLAYSAQDLILEPFAGTVFGLTPGESTQLAGLQHAGVLIGMLLVAVAVTGLRLGSVKAWTTGGCIASALSLISLACGGLLSPDWPLRANVFLLGLTNGAYAVAAIGSMMSLVATGHGRREGVRMGLWGAAQAIAFGLGGFLGTVAADLAGLVLQQPAQTYGLVFLFGAALFLVAGFLAARLQPVSAIGQPTAAVVQHNTLAQEAGDD